MYHLSVHPQNIAMNPPCCRRNAARCDRLCFCSWLSSSSSSSSPPPSSSSSSASLLPEVFQDGVAIRKVTFALNSFRTRLSSFKTKRYMTIVAPILILIVLSSCVLPAYSLTSVVPEISDFTTDERRHFIDISNSETFFHHLYIDPYNASSIYVGALDFVYRLNGDNINRTFERSENISNFINFTTIYHAAVDECRNSFAKKSRPDYQCRNHIRGILPNFNAREIYVCATGSYSPQDFYLDMRNLRVLRTGPGSGITKCPYDPDTNHTIIYVGPYSGTPNNLSAIYSSLLVGARYDYAIYRSALQSDDPYQTVGLSPLRSQDGPTVGELFYIASFEIDQYVYFFFREYTAKSSSYSHKHYSRVARVCKNDRGGIYERNRFLTYVKARLNCSVGTNDIPVYFDELYAVHYDSVNRVFYCLFMANVNAMWGSAVCKFDYETIERKFDSDPFYAPDTGIALDSQVPNPRPSLCKNDTQSLSITVQSFALSHTLMHGTVDQMTKSPLYYTHDVAYSHLTVDFVQKFTVLYLYSFTNPSEIVRVVTWFDKNKNVRFRKFSILKPFADSDLSIVWNIKIHTVNERKWLYVVTENSVIQVSVELCSSYELCTDCVKDPYCGWNADTLRCENFQQQDSSYLLRGVTNASSLSVCKSSCTVRTESKALPGAAIHLSCSSRCSPEGVVSWTWQRSGSSKQALVPTFSDPNYILSWNNGLVILNVSRYHIGTFRCISESISLAEHSVTTSACEYGEDVREIWIREFVSWCSAFDQYQSEYNLWLCLKDKCLRSSCVSQEVIDGCKKRLLT